MVETTKLRKIVRVVDKDVAGHIPISHALTKATGISFMLSNAICEVLKLNKYKPVGEFSKPEIEKIVECAKNPDKHNIPSWLYNRRKELESGKDVHLISSDLILREKFDVRLMQKIKSYRGVRHSIGAKKVRGQRTKSTGRRSGSLGVKRRKNAKKGK